MRPWLIAAFALGQAGCATVLGIDGDYDNAGGGNGTGANGTGANGTGANGTGGSGTGANGTGGGGTGAMGGNGTGGASTGGGSTGGSNTGGSATGGGGTGGSGNCPTAGGEMAQLTSYCMDKTEVTNAAYGAWLGTGPSAAGQPAYCSWNGSFGSASGAADKPVFNVDWCDARAFCADHGKRLCGLIGGAGAPTAFADRNDDGKSEWYRACTTAGSNAYPYGNTYQPEFCFGLEHSTNGLQDVGSAPDCHPSGTASEIVDLSGNAAEWTNSCSGFTGVGDKCAIRGGDVSDLSANLACSGSGEQDRDATEDKTGFRCCADL